MKKQKDQRKFKEEVKKGDKIVTLGGIHGKIAEIRDSVFIIDIENGGKMKIEKSAISMEYTNVANQKSWCFLGLNANMNLCALSRNWWWALWIADKSSPLRAFYLNLYHV